jgi:hypothetical protein
MTLFHSILHSLERVQPLMLPEPALFIEVNLLLPAPTSRTELRSSLAQMEDRRWINGIHDDLTGDTRWKISPLGRATLAEGN